MMSDLFECRLINAKKGRGLFAKKDILKGTILDKSDLLLITEEDYKIIENTIIGNYIFEWTDESNTNLTSAILFSPMELMNHSYNNNVNWELFKKEKIIEFKTIKDVKKGEELTVDYNNGDEGEDVVWFDVEE
jgi:SET domain-containing protein